MGEIPAVVVSSNKALGGLCILERSKEAEEQMRGMEWHKHVHGDENCWVFSREKRIDVYDYSG